MPGIMKYLFLCLLMLTCISSGWCTFSYINNFATTGNGYQYIVLDKGSQLWVCAYNQNSVRVFHPNGTEAPFSPITIGKNSSGSSITISQPSGIAIDTAGIIYVSCDNGATGNIFKFQSWDGTPLNGFEPSFRPGDLDIDSSNNVFITERFSTNARVRLYISNTSGTNLTFSPVSVSSSTTGLFSNPGIGVQKNGTTIYIAGETEGRVWKFTGTISNGTANFSQTADLTSGLGSVNACEVDSNNKIYVSSTTDNSVRIYDSLGGLSETLSGNGLTNPHGIGFYPNSQVLFISQYTTSASFQRWVITPTVQVPIMGYHNVTSAWGSALSHGLMVSPDNFGDQLNFLLNHGYNVISLDSLYAHIMYGATLPANPVCITFDDNYIGESQMGAPMLISKNMYGTIFLVTNFAGVVTGTGAHGSWSQLSTLDVGGSVKTESHTLNHPNLTTSTEGTAFSECSSSKKAIEINIPGKICNFLAYPNGGDTFTTTPLPRATLPTMQGQIGYKAAFSYAGGYACRTSPIFNIPRVIMSGDYTLNQYKTYLGYTGSRILADPYIVNNDGNGDGSFTSSGSWFSQTTVVGGNIGYYGTNYSWTSAGSGSKTAIFIPTITQASTYNVYAWWDADATRATNAPYTINYFGGSSTVTVNQQNNGFSWNLLGTFDFASGTTGTIILSDNANGIVTADAIKLEPTNPPVVVDLSWFMQTNALPLKKQY